MQPHKVYSVYNENIDYRIVGNKAIILNINNSFFYTLDEAGSIIWEALVKQKKLDEIADMVMDEYEVDREDAKRDIVELIDELEKERLVKPQ
jgi:hypothetical protein